MSKLKEYLERIIAEGLDTGYLFMTKQKLKNFYFPFFIARVVDNFQRYEKQSEFAKFYQQSFAADAYMSANYPEQGASENTYRNTISAEFFGLIKRSGSQYTTAMATPAFYCLQNYITSSEDIEKNKALIDRQIEKLCLNLNQNSAIYDKVSMNSTFITILLYKVLLLLDKKYGDSKLTTTEYLLFLNRAKSYNDFDTILELIEEYRRGVDDEESKLVSMVLDDNSTKTVRYTQILGTLSCITFKDNCYSINGDEYSKRYIASTVEMFENSKYAKMSSKAELQQFLESDDYFIGKLDAVAKIYTEYENNNLVFDEEFINDLKVYFDTVELIDYSKKYDDFNKLYSLETLKGLSDYDLALRLFAGKKFEEKGMPRGYFVWAEHGGQNDKRDAIPFGMAKGGKGGQSGVLIKADDTYHTYSYEYKPKRVCHDVEISRDEACELAKLVRDKLIEITDYINASELETYEDYKELHQYIKGILANTGETRLYWTAEGEPDGLFVKYLHCTFPEKFACWYSRKQLQYLVSLPYEKKIKEDSGLLLNSLLTFVAKAINIDNANFGHFYAKYAFELVEEGKEDKELDLTDDDNQLEDDENMQVLPTLEPRMTSKMPLNFILYGAPGTGKTYATAEYAMAIVERRNPDLAPKSQEERKILMNKYKTALYEGRVVFTTFHQSYGYEDFIQGLRPQTNDGVLDFVPTDGVFKKIADKAINDGTNDYVIIIDEINRANISKVFGELITLIEDDKRWGEVNALSVTLPSGQQFAVPNNLFIIGTMNSADKSISLIDTALRRRFDFIEVVPNEQLVEDSTLRTVLTRLNEGLVKELDSTDLLIGHAYFIGKTADDLCSIMNNNIIPLLYEYFYDNSKKVEKQVKDAVDGFDVEIKKATVGRIKLVKKG